MTSPGPTKLRISRPEASGKLQKRISEGEHLLARTIETEEALLSFCADQKIWSDYNLELINSLFTTREIGTQYDYPIVTHALMTFKEERAEAVYHLKQKLTILRSVLNRLEVIQEELSTSQGEPIAKTVLSNRRVFIVHGRDEGKRDTLARFIQQLGLEPIILHEQPNKGRTLIEKIEHNSDVGFAVVLLTGDDMGGLKDEPRTYKSRARQNVVLELGYFFGKLGRQHVCALYQKNVELPSDIGGLVYVELDEHSGWKTLLAKELKEAGYQLDASKLL